MLRKALVIAAALGLAISGPALAAGGAEHPKHVDWSFAGPVGKFDQAQLQRGFKVYREVCAQCHSLNLLSFRNLGEKHGPFYDAKYPNSNDNPYVKAIAAEYEIDDIDTETGDPIKRPGTSADRIPNPFANEYFARASMGGALPPDLSVIAKARAGGASYLYSVLVGYVENPPAGLNVPEGQYYNPYIPGDLSSSFKGDHKKAPLGALTAMPPPLAADKVAFDDGTKSTVDQQAKDVSAFLAWASEPKQIERKQTGLAVMIYLLFLSIIVYLSYRRVWRNESH